MVVKEAQESGAFFKGKKKIVLWHYVCSKRVPTFDKKIAGFGWMIDILNDFLQGFQNVKIFKIGQCSSTHKLCLACLLSFAEQASWAEHVCRGGLSDLKIMQGIFFRVEKISF